MSFQSTMWTVIAEAKRGSREALERLLTQYRPPIIGYLRSRGVSEHDAEDIVQDVFLEICDDGFLARADRSRGRFRSLLLAVTHNVLASDVRRKTAQKRGGGMRRASVEGDAVRLDDGDHARFDREWVRHVVRLALDGMRSERGRTRVAHADLLEMRYFEGLDNRAIAERLGCTTRDVENRLHVGRRRLRRHLLEITRAYSSSAEEIEDDLALLDRTLR